jgi:hypothetical protein
MQTMIWALFLVQSSTKMSFGEIQSQDPLSASFGIKFAKSAECHHFGANSHFRRHRANHCKTNAFLGLLSPIFTILRISCGNIAFWEPKLVFSPQSEEISKAT